MLYGLGGMAVCFTLLTSMFCFKVHTKLLLLSDLLKFIQNHLTLWILYAGGFL